MSRAAQYLRMSTEEQKYSLEIQAALVGAFATREGFTIVRTYADAGKSGVTTKGREGLKALIRDVLDGPDYSTVLVLDVSRWGRFQDPDEAGHFEFLCRSSGVQVRYCAEAFDDTDSATAIIMKSVKRAMAADFSRQLSERVRTGRRRLVEAGAWSGGTCAYGFTRQVFNPDGSKERILSPGQRKPRADQSIALIHGPAHEVENVRRVFDLFVHEGLTLTQISVRLNAMGIAYRQPGPWEPKRVRLILKNELAIGNYVYNRRVCRVGAKVRQNDPAEWKRRAVVKPLVTRALFEAAQERLRQPRGPRYMKEALIDHLGRLYAREGRLSVQLVDECADTPPMSAYITHFRTARKAFSQVGYVLPKPPPPDRTAAQAAKRQAVLEGLSRLLARRGYISERLIAEDPDLPCACTLRTWFGSLPAAYALVGYRTEHRLKLSAYWDEWRHKRQKGREMRAGKVSGEG